MSSSMTDDELIESLNDSGLSRESILSLMKAVDSAYERIDKGELVIR